MKDTAEPSPSATTLRSALLDYFEAPGKYQLTLRQPALLFSSIREILQIASGRGAAETASHDAARLQEAANFFIRAALLYPGADHYAVLGLRPGEAPPDLKERYRLLMRLIHPDYAAGPAEWPADAAVRVNRAYEILSSPVQRRQYDDQLASLRSQRPAPPVVPKALHAAAARRVEERSPRVGKKAALVFGLAVGIPAVLLLMPRAEPDHLVQRTAPASSARPESAPSAPANLATSDRLAPAASLHAPAGPVAPLPAPEPAPAAIGSAPLAPEPAAAPAPVVIARPTAPVAPPAPAAHRPAPVAAPVQPPPNPVVQARAPEPVRATPPALPVPEPAPATVAPPVPQPVLAAAVTPVAATAVPSAAPLGKLTATLALPANPPPTLADAQPLLTQMLQMLESGSGDQLLRLLDGDARRQPGAQALSRQVEQMVRGGRPVHLTQVEFNGEPRDGGVLLVTGRIRLHAGEPTIGSHAQKLVLKAEFAQRGGRVLLTGLSGSPD